jgi:hypothetical protein
MGVFEAIPQDGKPITATELSESLGVDKDLLGTLLHLAIIIQDDMLSLTDHCNCSLVRFMRAATIVGPFAEVGLEKYAHTPYSLAYLVPELRALFCFTYV